MQSEAYAHSELKGLKVKWLKGVASLRGESDANDAAISLSTRHWLTGLLRHYVPRNDTGGRAGFLFDWSLKSPVQPLWMALSAFTMAEILLSLTIIGVVAAITLPSLTGNINERTWNTQRKALYARFSQAVALMPALNGYGTYSQETDSAGSTSITDTAAETFITNGLAKVLKINNICDNEHLTDCGLPASYTNLLGSNSQMPLKISELNSNLISYSASGYSNTYSGIDTKAAAFETQNGESILLFYNPGCVSNMNETSWYFSQPKICVNMVYDLNGSKGPNTVGKDMGVMTILYPTDSVVVAPMPYNRRIDGVLSENAANACTVQAGDDYRIPTKDELASLFANKDIIGSSLIAGHMFSSSKFVSPTFGVVNWLILSTGEYRTPDSTTAWSIVCVKRN